MFVKKSRYIEVQNELKNLEDKYITLQDKAVKLERRAIQLEKDIEAFVSPEKPDLDGSAVTSFTIAANLIDVMPRIVYDPAVFEKLVETGYLNDTHTDNKFAIQLALLTITHEALTQIIESFSEDVKD